MKQILTKITNGEVLTREQTCQIVRHIADGEYNNVQISALLTGLIMRGIKVDEVLGLRDGLIETGQPVDFSPYRVIDIVGTGGDNKNTFNISTCACFVVAGAGYKVAKHGNYAATSTSGASNVIEHHGVRFTADSNRLRRSMEACNFAYLHAPLFAHGMKAVAPVRKMLQIPTCFNLLGPLVNPCRPAYQLLGVANLNQMRLYSSVYEKLGIGYGIVNSIDGYDEISLTGNFKVKTNTMEKIFRPADRPPGRALRWCNPGRGCGNFRQRTRKPLHGKPEKRGIGQCGLCHQSHRTGQGHRRMPRHSPRIIGKRARPDLPENIRGT